MSQTPKVFISFSGKDQREVRKLFSALEIQNVRVWDYSDEGEELPLAHELRASLKKKIDSCEYFIAVISPNSIDERIGRDPRFEVCYAIESGKANNNRILPLLLDNPSDQWLGLYAQLERILRITFNDDSEEQFEDTIRRICQWLSAPYTPSLLTDPRVFFAKLFLEEVQNKPLDNADFVQLLRVMNSCANKVLMEDWKGVKEKTNLFLSLAHEIAPEAAFHYPLVIKGVCELQLKEFEDAERTFLQATTNQDISTNPLLGLGFAGLGHTYASLERFDESLSAFQKAIELEPDDKYLQFNYLGAIFRAGGVILAEAVLDVFDLSKLPPEDRLKVITLKGALNYKNGNYRGAISAFGGLDLNDLDEASSIYYSLALRESGGEEKAIQVLYFSANKIKSANLYHHLVDAYLSAGDMSHALSIYEDVLCNVTKPSEYARQILIEYAQIIRVIEGENTKFQKACESAVNFKVLPPPQSKADCFFTGFAYYLLGRSDLAQHYHDNSSGFSAQYYDEIELTTNAGISAARRDRPHSMPTIHDEGDANTKPF